MIISFWIGGPGRADHVIMVAVAAESYDGDYAHTADPSSGVDLPELSVGQSSR